MDDTFETLRLLPEVGGSRYGSLPVGYDRVRTLREEHAQLLQCVALIVGVAPDRLTRTQVAEVYGAIQNRAVYPITDRVRTMHQTVALVDAAVRRDEAEPVAARRDLARDAALWVL